MGCSQSSTAANLKFEPPKIEYLTDSSQTYHLKKRRPGCSGMFWRPDPTGTTPLEGNQNYPRDGAQLQGQVVQVNGKKWLLTVQVLQKDAKEWVPAPKGAAMPFEYDDHYYLE